METVEKTVFLLLTVKYDDFWKLIDFEKILTFKWIAPQKLRIFNQKHRVFTIQYEFRVDSSYEIGIVW
jgi:hypothetical protein